MANREIIFRGKRRANGEWVRGHYIFDNTTSKAYITKIGEFCHEVSPETVGEYTGLTDRYCKRIYEGDIVQYNDEYAKIEYSPEEAIYNMVFDTWLTDFDHIYSGRVEVVGNIHDTPEFLEACNDTRKSD